MSSDFAMPECERPLPPIRNGLYLLIGILLVALFYVYSALFLLVGALLWPLLFILMLLDPQFRGRNIIAPLLLGLGAAMQTFASSLLLKGGPEYDLKLQREQAPRLWEVAEELSQRLSMAPPHEFYLKNNCGAHVFLKGLVAGRGKTRISIGFDLLAALTEAQARAVIAHEIAHAKLVKRGYRGFLMHGLFRVSLCARNLGILRDSKQSARSVCVLMQKVGVLPEKIATVVGKLSAACSRYEEFRADRVAAEICGPDICRAALLVGGVASEVADRIPHRQRLLQIEREASYSDWLRQEINVSDETQRLELEERQMNRSPRYDLSSHPALPDRLAALEQIERGSDEIEGDESGLAWLSEPDEIGAELLRHIEQVAAQQEAKVTKWVTKRTFSTENLIQNRFDRFLLLAALVMVSILIPLAGGLQQSLAQGRSRVAMPFWLVWLIYGVLVFGVVFCLILAGLVVHRWLKAPIKVGALPVPPLVVYQAMQMRHQDRKHALDAITHAQQAMSAAQRCNEQRANDEKNERITQENVALGATLRASVPTQPRRRCFQGAPSDSARECAHRFGEA